MSTAKEYLEMADTLAAWDAEVGDLKTIPKGLASNAAALLREAADDVERLDWIQEYGPGVHVYGDNSVALDIDNPDDEGPVGGRNLREAIDTARAILGTD